MKYEAAIAAYRQSPEYRDWLRAVRASQTQQQPDFTSMGAPPRNGVFTESANMVENGSASSSSSSLERDPLGSAIAIKIELLAKDNNKRRDIQVVERPRKRQSASPDTNGEGSDVDSPDEEEAVDDIKVKRVE